MIKFFKSLFSTDETIKAGVDALINTGDALVYTDEEKAQAAAENRQWYLELMKAVSPSARSRRGVAWSILGMVSLLSIIAVICQLTGQKESAQWILELLNELWSMPFVAVVGFYFAPSLLAKLK